MCSKKETASSYSTDRSRSVNSGNRPAIDALEPVEAVEPEPLAEELGREPARLRVAQHPAGLALQFRGLPQPTPGGRRAELLVGHRRPEEEAEPAGELPVRTAARSRADRPAAARPGTGRPGRPGCGPAAPGSRARDPDRQPAAGRRSRAAAPVRPGRAADARPARRTAARLPRGPARRRGGPPASRRTRPSDAARTGAAPPAGGRSPPGRGRRSPCP